MLDSKGSRWMILAATVALALVSLSLAAQAGLGGVPHASDVQPVVAPAQDALQVGRDAVLEARDDTLHGGADPAPSNPADQTPASGPVGSARDVALGSVQPVLDKVPSDPVGVALGHATNAAKDTGAQLRGVLAPVVTPASNDEGAAPAPQAATSETVLSTHPVLAGGLLLVTVAGATAVSLWLAGSSSTVGAGAALTAGAKSTELRRLLPFASPLFTRFEKDTVLGHPRREALYALILQQPGVSLQALGDAAGLSRTAVLHHLRLLELQHLVVSKRVGRSRHYYENGGRYGRDQKEAYAVLQNERTRQVADFVKAHPGTMQKAVCAALGIQPSIAHWHVKRLQDAQLVEAVRKGRTVAYFPGQTLAAGIQAAPVPLPAMPAPTPAAVAGPALPA